MAAHSGDSYSADGADCPICLDVFNSPRQLPCMHAFCEKCLQDHISTYVGDKGGAVKEFVCPVCRAVTNPNKTGKPVGEWASVFPRSAISVTTELIVKVERYCDACRYEGESNKAEGFCVVCEEGFCSTCLKVHQKTTSTRNHKIISIDELTSTTENRIRFAEGFGCPDHQEKQIEYYCQIHDAVCCADCFFLNHRSCDNVKRLNADLPSLMTELKPEEIIDKMKKIEKHLQNFIKKNESNIYKLEAKVNNLTAEILDIRQRINKKLDEIEALVKREGNQIYQEEMIKRQEENHQCQSLINAVRNSHTFLETVLKYGTDTQKFLVCKKSLTQYKPYTDQIREKYEKIESVTVHLELGKNMQSMLSQYFSSVANLESNPERTSFPCSTIINSPLYSSISKPLIRRQLKLDKVVKIRSAGKKKPMYTGIVHLPDGSVLLADYNSKTCCLYDSSYNFVSSYTLPAEPFVICLMDHREVTEVEPRNMCLMDHCEVAVTLADKGTVQFLSIRHSCIKDTGTVSTRYPCSGVATLSRDEIVVSGHTDDWKKCYWSIVSRRVGETYHHAFNNSNPNITFVNLNNAHTRVYISVSQTNEVFCFGLTDGKQYFIYTSKDLTEPYGIAVDRDDNIFITGNGSHNIHKLSTDGKMLQVITAGVPQYPMNIVFDRSQEHFILTNVSNLEQTKLHIFVQK